MNPLAVVCCKWTDPRWPHTYTAEHVNVFADSITRNLQIPHKVFCATDDPQGIHPSVGIIPLWQDFREQGDCFLRLRLFSEEMKERIGARIVSIDLDSVITGDLTPLFAGEEDFKIAKDTQPNFPYNGSMFMMRAGARKQVFEEFDPPIALERIRKAGHAPMDQTWFATCLGNQEATWDQKDGVYSFKNDIMRKHAGALPTDSRIVFFHGNPKPWHFTDCGQAENWIRTNWRRNRRGLLILGGASCVWDQLKELDTTQFGVMATNDMGYTYPGRIDYWATLHPEKLEDWKKKRLGNQDYETWSYTNVSRAGINKLLPDFWAASTGLSGSSGMFAAQIGLKLNYDYILLAGVPMDEQHNQTGPKPCWNQSVADNFWVAWQEHAHKMKGRVFSLSGRTRDLLGFREYEP